MGVCVKVVNMASLLASADALILPSYQLSYRWSEAFATALVRDIDNARMKKSYRLGQIVLYEGDGKRFVIDGMQRLITLHLIARTLSLPSSFSGEKRWDASSRHRLRMNAHEIARAMKRVDRTLFVPFFLEKTEVIIITAPSLPSAFRFIDSAASRGKALDPADLLKAYHLCAMRGESEELKLNAVRIWECLGRERIYALFTLWYPVRSWLQNRVAYFFTDRETWAFEGVSPSCTYPFASRLSDQPFQLGAVIQDGNSFFLMCFHYDELMTRLDRLIDQTMPHLHSRYLALGGSDNIADQYAYALFRSTLFLYLDRFGEVDFESALRVCFKFAFSLRLAYPGLSWSRVNEHVLSSESLFHQIATSLSPYTVISYDFERYLGDMRLMAGRGRMRPRPIDWDHDFDTYFEE